MSIWQSAEVIKNILKKKKRKEKEKKGHGKRKKKVLNEVLTENKDTLVLVQKIWKLRIIDW